MSSTAQYANSPRVGIANISTANTNRDGTGTIVAAFVAGSSGSRIDKVVIEATSTTTAGMVRLFITKGKAGVTISTITFVGTTATVTTAAAHGLSTGNKITVQGAFPDDYNVTDVAVTVTGATTFTYTMSTTPTLNASTVGAYSSTPSTVGTSSCACARNPTINAPGNGQGCEPRYWQAVTRTLLSSCTSRATVCSKVSPGSTKPASTE